MEARPCVVCRLGVRGLWMGCRRCRHGGHEGCLRAYYREWQLHMAHSANQVVSFMVIEGIAIRDSLSPGVIAESQSTTSTYPQHLPTVHHAVETSIATGTKMTAPQASKTETETPS